VRKNGAAPSSWPGSPHRCPVRFSSQSLRSPLDVTSESALALIRGLPQYLGSSFCKFPDSARKAHFRDDDVENSAELNRTAVGSTRPSSAAPVTLDGRLKGGQDSEGGAGLLRAARFCGAGARPDRAAGAGGFPCGARLRSCCARCDIWSGGRSIQRVRFALDLDRLAAVDPVIASVLRYRRLRKPHSGKEGAGQKN
jgi:hypothetical protein